MFQKRVKIPTSPLTLFSNWSSSFESQTWSLAIGILRVPINYIRGLRIDSECWSPCGIADRYCNGWFTRNCSIFLCERNGIWINVISSFGSVFRASNLEDGWTYWPFFFHVWGFLDQLREQRLGMRSNFLYTASLSLKQERHRTKQICTIDCKSVALLIECNDYDRSITYHMYNLQTSQLLLLL